MRKTEPIRHTVEPTEAGQRADVYLAARLGLSRTRVQTLCDEGQILLNEGACKHSARLRPGDFLAVTLPPEAPRQATPQEIPLDIVHEDDHLIVVNKPAGLVVHPAPGHADQTLVNGLLHHCGALAPTGSPLRPGIVHRLDKDTSGLLVVAKTDQAYHGLVKLFAHHDIDREYRAWVYGMMPALKGVIETLISRHPTDRKRFTSRAGQGKQAVTKWEMLRNYNILSVLRITLDTGRTHQIRVHLSEIGHPLVGDPVYRLGGVHAAIQNTSLRAELSRLKRQALHARLLGFVHPVTGKKLVFEAPLPDDLIHLNQFLEQLFGVQQEDNDRRMDE